MDAANPFAQTPMTPEPIIAQVRRQLRSEVGPGELATDALVDTTVDRVVRELWGSRVKTFVPILALRESRDLLREERFATLQFPAGQPVAEVSAAATDHPPAGSGRDRVAIGRDAIGIDWRDALRVDDDVLPL